MTTAPPNCKCLATPLVTFPIRGHSYMECDKDMGILNGKFRAEVPDDWCKHIETARLKPTPFLVEEVDHYMIRNWTYFLSAMYALSPHAQSGN